MKKSILFLSIFFFALSLSAQEPQVKFYKIDGTNKTYNINDITNIGISSKSGNCSMKLFRKGIMSAEFLTKNIDKILFESDSSNYEVLGIYIANTTSKFLLSEIDSICFFVIPTPKITVVTPLSGQTGDEITINGNNFGADQTSGIVSINGTKATTINSWSNSQIILEVPSSAESGKLSVSVSGLKSNEVDFIVIPTLISIDSAFGNIGDIITLTGNTFGSSRGTSVVHFAASDASEYTTWNKTSIIVKVPVSAESGKLYVKVNGQRSNEVDFAVIPIISRINPDSAKIGDSIRITGTGFGTYKVTNFVSFNGTNSTDFSSWSSTSIVVKVPTGASSGKLAVSVRGQISNEVDFKLVIPSSTEVKIGTQVWTIKNFYDYCFYRNGDPIPLISDPTEWSDLTTGAWCYYDNNQNNGKTLGKLFNWYAIHDPRGFGPFGWHVPSDAEWTTLATFLGGDSIAGGKLKEAGFAHWASPNTGATNESGFTAIPSGYRTSDGTFRELSYNAYLWSSTAYSNEFGWLRALLCNNACLLKLSDDKRNGYPIRFIKD